MKTKTIDQKIIVAPTSKNKIKKESIPTYDSKAEYKSFVNHIINDMVSRNAQRPCGILLNTKFYYIENCNIYGPVTGKKLISLVKNHRINKNCFVRQTMEKGYEKRAYEIVELVDNDINDIVSENANKYLPISLNTKFYYIEDCNIYGPVTGKKLLSLVKNNRINKNCFVRQKFEKGFEKRAYEIVELLDNI